MMRTPALACTGHVVIRFTIVCDQRPPVKTDATYGTNFITPDMIGGLHYPSAVPVARTR